MEQIVKTIKSGNKERFREIVIAYEDEIYRYILKMVSQSSTAEELTQDVFVSAYTKLYQYKAGISFRAWLYKIAKNTTLNHLKRQSKYMEIQKKIRFEKQVIVNDSQADDYNEAVERALVGLNDKEKNLLILKAVEELSYKELSVVFNRTESTLRKQFERAKTKFRKYYDQLEGEC